MVDAHFLDGGAGERAVDDGGVDAGFFEDVPVLQDAGYAAAAGGSAPGVGAEFGSVELLQLLHDDGLLLFYESFHAEAHG